MDDPNKIIEGWGITPSVDDNDPNKIIESWGGDFTPQSFDPEQPLQRDYTTMDYSSVDLVDDEFFLPVQNYMVSRYGTHMEDLEREDLVEKYLNNMRGFSGGNSVRAIYELSYLSSLEEEELKKAGEAYAIFENLPNIYSERASWSDTFGGTWDYVRSGVFDPVNLLGGIIGKSVTSGGFKGGAMAASVAAKKSYQKALTKGISRGLTQEAAEKAAETAATRVYTGVGRRIVAQQTAQATARQKAAESALTRVLGRQALAETATMAGVDALAAGAADYGYQSAMEMTGIADDVSIGQSAIVAGTTLVLGGMLYAGQGLFRRSGSTVGPDLSDLKNYREGAKISSVAEGMADAMAKNPKANKWIEDVTAGKELDDLDVGFWKTMVNGDEELGIQGLKQILVDQQYVWVPRDGEDKITNFLGDIIKESDPQDFEKFIDTFRSATGNKMKSLEGMDREAFANAFKRKVSDAGTISNLMSQVSRELGIENSNMTGEDVWKYLNGDAGTLGGFMDDLAARGIPRAQNQLIRLLVSNLSTTQLNLLGWSAATSLDSAKDLVTASILAPVGAIKLLSTGDSVALGKARVLVTSQVRKLANTLDPNTTYDQFLKYAEARPKALRELTHVLPGGVEDIAKLSDEMDLSQSLTSMRTDQAINVIQQLTLVKSQDAYTKSIEFMTEIDKLLRMPEEAGGYGLSYKDFMGQEDYWKLMKTEKYAKIEQAAVRTALDNVFSRSYGKMGGPLGDVADFIEKARNIPGVGVLMPFGRFFNNTVAFMSDYSGISLAGAVTGLNRKTSETKGSLAARTAVGWGLIMSLSENERGYLNSGLAWDEQPELGDTTGAVTSEKYNFPYAFFKGAARMVAYMREGKEIPAEEVSDWLKTVGPEGFTREVADLFGDSGDSVINILTNPENNKDLILDVAGKIFGQVVSSGTRFIEPVNSLVGMSQGTDRVMQDRRQGNVVFKEATRYMDNLIALVNPDTMGEQRHSATRGPQRAQDGKFIAPIREVRPSNLSRVAHLVGVPEWDNSITMIGADSPEASNRYAQIYFNVNEDSAGRLLKDPKFVNGSLEVKESMFSNLLKSNKEIVKRYMEADLFAGDAHLLRQADIQNKNTDEDIQRALSDLEIEKDFEELSTEELLLLESALKFREEIILRR